MLEGLPPNNASTIVSVTCDEGLARAAADLVVELCDPAQIAAAAFEVESSDRTVKPWRLEVYLAPGIDAGHARTLLAGVLGDDLAAAIRTEAVSERDWVTSSLAGLAPVRAGRFVIYGRHHRSALRANDVGLEIEAALAFGTGHHGTTQGCLLALDAVLKRRRPRRVLDIGIGTGVLAMAAARVLKRPVACGDIDVVAVEAASENARQNGVGRFVRPVQASGLQHPRLRAGAPYDLVFANILAGPLRGLAPAIARVAAREADIIVSGLLEGDVAGVVSRYRTQGLFLVSRRLIEGWATLTFASGPVPSRGHERRA